MTGLARRLVLLCLLGAMLPACTFYRTREGLTRYSEPAELKSIDPEYEPRQEYKWTTWAFVFGVVADVLTFPFSVPYDLGHLLFTGKFPDPTVTPFYEPKDDFEPM